MSRQHARLSAQTSSEAEDKLHDPQLRVHTRTHSKTRSQSSPGSRTLYAAAARLLPAVLLTLVVVAGYLFFSWRRLGLGSLFRCASPLPEPATDHFVPRAP